MHYSRRPSDATTNILHSTCSPHGCKHSPYLYALCRAYNTTTMELNRVIASPKSISQIHKFDGRNNFANIVDQSATGVLISIKMEMYILYCILIISSSKLTREPGIPTSEYLYYMQSCSVCLWAIFQDSVPFQSC